MILDWRKHLNTLGPLVGRFAGIEKRPVTFEVNGLNFAVTAGELIDQACEGLPSAVKSPMH